MTLARQLATQVASSHGRDPWMIADRLGVPVYEESLPAGLTELYVEDPGNEQLRAIVLSRGLQEKVAREMLAHALAHHFMHVGNRLTREPNALWSGRHEREADDFAAFLLVPRQQLECLLADVDGPSDGELADYFSVTRKLVQRRTALLAREHEGLDMVSTG